MKKIFKTLSVLIISGLVVASVQAAPAQVPAGTHVSATCNGDNTATTSIDGVSVLNYEAYDYEGVEEMTMTEGQTVMHNLDAGRRFNFTFGKTGTYALLTPEMAGYGVSFIGSNLGIDCKNRKGCAFIITCPNVAVQ